MWRARAVLIAWVATASAASAQQAELASLVAAPALEIGALVRVQKGPVRLTGRLAQVVGDTLLLHLRPIPIRRRVPITLATPMSVSIGHVSRARGALLGAGVGLLSGLVIGVVIADAFDASANDAIELSGFFLPYTVPAGAIAGAIFPGHRWAPVVFTSR